MKAKSLVMLTLGGLATVATVLGTAALIKFDVTPGLPSRAPLRWPSDTKVTRSFGHPQIVVFAHPLCSCTRATLTELEQLPGTSITVEFFRPGSGSTWAKSATWDAARQSLGASVAWDDEGREAKRFGSGTSGTVLLYSAKGELLFEGGVTPSRGHGGENFGFTNLAEALRTEKPQNTTRPVFGCGLFNVQALGVAL